MTLTVFVLTYNRCEFLKSAIDSILNQSYSDFLLWVLDNCSSDGTAEYIKTIKDPRIRYTCHEKNIGGFGNIKYAFEHCETDYFCVFHDDDILHKNLLMKEIECLKNIDSCVAVTCLNNIINEDGITVKISKISNKEKKSYRGEEFFYRYLNTQQSFTFPTTMYRTAFIKNNRILPIKEAGPSADVLLYMEIERKGGLIIELQEALFDYRIHPAQDSSIHLAKMLLSLMDYLNHDTYYRMLLLRHLKARKRFLRWYGRKLIICVASERICVNEAFSFYFKMKNILECSSFASLGLLFILYLEKVFPLLFNRIYKLLKKGNE